MRLLLIAGHGSGDPGAISGSWYEATETRKLSDALSDALEGYCDVDQYPLERNAYSDYKSGLLTKTAGFNQYDLVLELHFNASTASPSDGITKGVECYVPINETNTSLATSICRSIAAIGLNNRGVKKYNWAVINTAHRAGPLAMLLETCFIDDPDDMLLYSNKFQSVVNAIASAIINGYQLKKEDSHMTDQEFAAFMARYEANRAEQQPNPWSQEARKWAEANRYINGNDKGQLRYAAPVTREELVQMLYNILGTI